MGLAYSRSQGKFIQVPDQPQQGVGGIPGQSSPTPTSMPQVSSGMGQSGFDWSNEAAIQQRRNAALKLGIKPAQIDSYIDKQRTNYATEQLANTGQLDYGNYQKLIGSNPSLALKIVKSGKVPLNPEKEKKSADQIKKENASSAVTNLIQILEKNYQDAGGAGGRLGGIGTHISAITGANDSAATYSDTKAGFAATLKSLTGDVGVLTDKDYARLAKLLPDFTSTPGEAQNKFNQLRSQLAAAFGGPKTTTSIKSQKSKEQPLEAKISKTGVFDIPVLGGLLRGAEGSLESAGRLAAGTGFEGARAVSSAMGNKNAYKTYAGGGGPQNPFLNREELQTYSNPVTSIPAAAGTGANAALTISALSSLPGLYKNITNLPKNISKGAGGRLSSQETLGKTREALAKGLKVDTNPLIKAGDDYVANIDPAARKAWETLKPAIKPETSLTDLLEKLSNWGSKAYTKSGDKRAITEGLLKSHLYQSGRNIIAKNAPEVAKLTGQMANRAGLEALLKKVAVPAAVGAGASAGIGIPLYTLLRGGGGY